VNIVLVTSSVTSGGAEKMIVGMANYWSEANSVTIIYFDEGRSYFDVDERVKLRRIDAPGFVVGVFSTLDRILSLRREIRSLAPDVLISFLGKINVISWIATRGLGVPLILSERNNPYLQPLRLSWRFLRSITYRMADKLVVPTTGLRDSLPIQIRRRAEVIPNWVEVDLLAAPPIKPVIIATGRLVHQKGFDLLLRAFRQIADECPGWRLIIHGEGVLLGELIELRDHLQLTDKVTFPGVTQRPQEWLGEGSIFVLSSRYEGFGNVLLEAMAAGLAVVSFNCPWGPSEIIDDGVDGILVPEGDITSLAQAMLRLITSPALRSKLGAAAHRNAHRLARSNVMPRWNNLLKSLCRRSMSSIE
jgi:glycosyltransferase involved in cell wall biosynthesis